MFTKLIAIVGLVLGAQIAFADSDGIWADGGVTYLHPNGRLIKRDCQLWVPSRGQGEVKLKCGDWSTSTTEFSTKHEGGKVEFSVVFRDVPGAPAGATALYRGAYLRGSNRAIYYGDVSSGSATTLESSSNDWKYVGGFMFSKAITQAE